MPLNKSLRDEEKERINAILKKLVELLYVPNLEKTAIDDQLKSLGLTTEILLTSSGTDLIQHLERLHFDWENTEKFADYLVNLAEKLPAEKANLIEKAVLIYNYIQCESKTFSFDIFGKIATIKARL